MGRKINCSPFTDRDFSGIMRKAYISVLLKYPEIQECLTNFMPFIFNFAECNEKASTELLYILVSAKDWEYTKS